MPLIPTRPMGLLLTALLAFAAMPLRAEGPTPLARLIDEALAHNPELRAASAAAEAARQRIAPSAALEDPMLEAGVLNAPVPGLSLNREDMTMRMLGISQKLPFPGKRGLRQAVATAESASAAMAVLETRNRLVRDLRVAYSQLQRADADERLVLRTRAVLQDLVAAAEARLALGEATQGEVLAAQSRLAQLQLELLKASAQQQASVAMLRRLLGRNDDVPIEPVPASLPSHDAPGLAATAGDTPQALAMRPQLQGLAAMADGAARSRELAERERYPDFELRLNYGQRQRAPDGMQRDDMVSFTVAVNLPIWRQGRTAPRIAEAIALQRQAEAMLEAQSQEQQAQLASARAAARQGREVALLYRDTLLPQAQALLESALDAWRAGRGPFSELLEAQAASTEAERAESEAIADHDEALAEIDLLAGVPLDMLRETQP
jgi:outer membrane protein, heavy metal efflux system